MHCFITVWNRFSWLDPLCKDFVKAGLIPILIDNNSTYPPCVEWIERCPYTVIRMNKNHGPWAFFTTPLYQKYTDRYFMISDSDQDISGIPSDWVNVLMRGLELHTDSQIWKSGLSQRIDDLPKDNPYAQEIYNYEKGFYNNLTPHGYYKVFMDLGIAVYDRSRRGEDPISQDGWYCAVRSQAPYVSMHLDWYITPETMREEDKYYLQESAKTKIHHGWLMNWVKKYNKEIF